MGLAFIIQVILEGEGYEVVTAKDGKDGYLVYLLFRPDLVITDIQMPGMNGLEMIRKIRIHDPGVRTIYMSGELDRFWPLLVEERRTHRVSLLKKPFSRTELMSLVSEVLSWELR